MLQKHLIYFIAVLFYFIAGWSTHEN